MTIWNSKKYQEIIIDHVPFICRNCGISTILNDKNSYYFFGNGKNSSNQYYDEEIGTYFVLYNGKEVTLKEYFKGDIVAWKCDTCQEVTLSRALDGKPIPIILEDDDWREIENQISIKNVQLKRLIKEFYTCKKLKLFSAATLLARKILMHMVVDLGILGESENFKSYVDALEKSDYVSRNWKKKVNIIRELGNEENHEVKIASEQELNNVAEVIKNLLSNIYVDSDPGSIILNEFLSEDTKTA